MPRNRGTLAPTASVLDAKAEQEGETSPQPTSLWEGYVHAAWLGGFSVIGYSETKEGRVSRASLSSAAEDYGKFELGRPRVKRAFWADSPKDTLILTGFIPPILA